MSWRRVLAGVGSDGALQQGFWGWAPKGIACKPCCREKPRSVLRDASYLANAVTVSLKWLSHNARGEDFCLVSLWTRLTPFPGA